MSAAVVFEAFFELQEQGRTIIIVTHDRDLVRDVPSVLTVKDGLIEGSPVEAAASRRTREQQAARVNAL
jgi:ABC-type lipoprotein export system ATPase subunit